MNYNKEKSNINLLMDKFTFTLRKSAEGFITRSTNYNKQLKGNNKQEIITQLNADMGNGYIRVRRKKIMFSKLIPQKKNIV